MTNQEKARIVELKNNGESYASISRIMGVNESTVKTIYSRWKNNSRCLYCGKNLIQTRGHRQKKYCSNVCKDAFWNEKRCGGNYDK